MKQNNYKIINWIEKVSSGPNQQAWDNGELGKEVLYAKNSDYTNTDNSPLPTSIRLPKNLIEELKKMAAEKGLSYQTYLKMILIKHIKNKVA